MASFLNIVMIRRQFVGSDYSRPTRIFLSFMARGCLADSDSRRLWADEVERDERGGPGSNAARRNKSSRRPLKTMHTGNVPGRRELTTTEKRSKIPVKPVKTQ